MSLFKKWFAQDDETYTIDGCKSAQKVISKYGYSFVCPGDLEEVQTTSDPYCAQAQKIASKYGYAITCSE